MVAQENVYRTTTMTKKFLVAFFLVASSLNADPEQCRTVRIADIGWTDVSATTAIAKQLLIRLKYEPKVSVLSLPVTLAALKNNDLDLFLGNWMPTQEADVRPFLNSGQVVQIAKNLSDAKFSLAVPDYVYQAGVHSLADLSKFKGRFKQKIYGIEAGNDGNRLIISMLKDQAFALVGWEIVESSEQAMLVELNQAIKEQNWMVFLAWSPHPMNLVHKINYLAGGDDYFGPNLGASEVFSLARRNLAEDCPNLAAFIAKLHFSVELENQLMNAILNQGYSADQAALRWLESNPSEQLAWLSGVNDAEGQPVTLSTKSQPAEQPRWVLPIGAVIERAVHFLTNNFSHEFRGLASAIEIAVDGLVSLILSVPWQFLIGLFMLLSWLVHRSLLLVLGMASGLLTIVMMSLWTETIQTLVLVGLASIISIVIGVPIGIMAARRRIIYTILRPILDLMQTIPTFVYLIPTLMLFGLGLVPGLISTVIFAIAAPIRLSYLGIKAVPKDLLEASNSFGASPMQTLLKVEIPSAMPSIMVGFTQCIMLSLSMVVIAALVGAEGLGAPVVRALNTVNIKLGFESGLAIVILAIILDRLLSFRSRGCS